MLNILYVDKVDIGVILVIEQTKKRHYKVVKRLSNE